MELLLLYKECSDMIPKMSFLAKKHSCMDHQLPIMLTALFKVKHVMCAYDIELCLLEDRGMLGATEIMKHCGCLIFKVRIYS